jgi:hypothetical protein
MVREAASDRELLSTSRVLKADFTCLVVTEMSGSPSACDDAWSSRRVVAGALRSQTRSNSRQHKSAGTGAPCLGQRSRLIWSVPKATPVGVLASLARP